MGHRLSKIYTRTGDHGTTGLGNGRRVPKDDLRVITFGALDELNSTIGVVLAEESLPNDILVELVQIQNQLFDLGSEFCLPGYQAINEQHVENLETILDKFNEDLPPLKEFILPGGHRAAAMCHVARTVCRRAECHAVSLARIETLSPISLKYLNRLSDLLFVLARSINHFYQHPEPLWQHEKVKKPKAKPKKNERNKKE